MQTDHGAQAGSPSTDAEFDSQALRPFMPRLDAIELMSYEDRQAFANRLALELLRPGGMEKIDPKGQPASIFYPPRPEAPKVPKSRPLQPRVRRRTSRPRSTVPAALPKLAPFTMPAPKPRPDPFERHSVANMDAARARAAEAL